MRNMLLLGTLLSAALSPGAVAQDARAGDPPTELPLHTALAAGDLDAIRTLLQGGADPNAVISPAGPDRRTPLSMVFDWPAEKEGSEEALRLLLEAGANPNGLFNGYGMPGAEEPPVGVAAAVPPLLRLLLEAGADPNVGWCSWDSEYTPMLMAEAAEEVESIALLRAAGAHRSSLDLALARDPAGAALHAAVSEHDVARVRQLLEAGSDPNAALVGLRFIDGMVERVRPLRLAFPRHGGDLPPESRSVRNEVVRLLVERGADVNEPFEFACGAGSPTALLIAAAEGDEDLVKLLLEAGADPNAGAKAFGASLAQPLIMATGAGNVRIVQWLLDAGADANAVAEADDARLTALDLALSEEHAEIAEMLRARGGTAIAPARPAPARPAPGDEIPREFLGAFHDACTAGPVFDSSSPELGVTVRYEIMGPDGGGCRVSLTYESNPNPDWVRKPLLLTLDPKQRFMAEIEAGMSSCTTGAASRFNCAGPLLELLVREEAGTAPLAR